VIESPLDSETAEEVEQNREVEVAFKGTVIVPPLHWKTRLDGMSNVAPPVPMSRSPLSSSNIPAPAPVKGPTGGDGHDASRGGTVPGSLTAVIGRDSTTGRDRHGNRRIPTRSSWIVQAAGGGRHGARGTCVEPA